MSPLKRTFWLGAGLILLSNAVALGGVYYNRSGEPDSLLQLSERELAMTYDRVIDGSDFAGQVLQLEFRLAKGWVTPDKLRALGFEVAEQGSSYSRDRLDRDGLVVLELNGEHYQTELAAAQAELKQAQGEFAALPESPEAKEKMQMADYELERLLANDTRLYVVDAGLDGDSLRQRYPDRRRYSVARASMRMGVDWTPAVPTADDYTLYVDLAELSVPGRWRGVFSGWEPYNRDAQDRSKVEVELAFGKRFEPWITAAQKRELPTP